MRFDTPIYFVRIQPGEYDASTGNYGEDTKEEMRYTAVTDTGTQTMTIIYGALKQGSKTIRLQNHYTKPFDSIRIGEKKYHVDRERKLRVKQTFIVSEVQ